MSYAIISLGLIVFIQIGCNASTIAVKKANLNEKFSIDCNVDVYEFCFANYILRDEKLHVMDKVKASDSFKFKKDSQKVVIDRIDEDHIGFYACGINCSSISYFDHLFFLQPFGKKRHF